MKTLSKRFLSIVAVLAMLMTMLSVLPVSAEDDAEQLQEMALIKSRFAEHFLSADAGRYADMTQAEAYLKTIQADGSWADIDYYDQTHTANGLIWQPKMALARMLAMSVAYCNPSGTHYHDAAMLNAVQKGLEHWRTIRDANPNQADYEGPWCSNWWENGFGIGQHIYKIGILLEKELTPENMAMICRKLERLGSTGTGQNALWQTQNALHRALLENNAAYFKKTVDECLYANLGRSDKLGDEALMVDNSFHAHGNLMYSNGYGKSLIQDLSLWIYFLRDTSFALPQKTLDLMADYILDGNRWMIRGDLLEMGTLYQEFDTNWAYQNYAVPLQRMIASDPDRADEYQKLLDNIMGKCVDNGLSGNKAMWTSAYMSHMREGYGVNVRTDTAIMKSSEWRSTWPEEELGCLVFWTTAGMTTVAVDGDEYRTVLPTYDWRHIPGTTTPYYFSDRYNDFDNGNDDSIVVSNGQYGTISYTYEKTDIRPKAGNEYSGATTGGKLSCFFFDEEYVALGTDIHSNHKAPIHTTVNQTKAADTLVNGTEVAAGANGAAYKADWVYNNKIGYVFPQQTTVKVSRLNQTGMNPSLWAQNSTAEDTFSLWMDHGVAPTDASYAYIVLPNATAEQTAAYGQNNPIVIVANTDMVQAVRHEKLKQTQVNFYKAGSLEYAPGKTVTVDTACSLIIDESGSTPIVTQAVSNTKPKTTCTVTLTIDGATTRTVYQSGSEPYTGQSKTLVAGDSTFITSGQSAQGSIGLVFDGNQNTTWKAASAADSWVVCDMQNTMDPETLTIHWGDTYATAYTVLTSTDGETWTTAYTCTNGNGGTDEIALNTSARYWKLECKNLTGNGGAAIAEIVFIDKDFAYATPEYPDMTALKQAIAQPVQEHLYTEETLSAYQQSLKKAAKLLVLPYATQNMVMDMIAELTTNREALTLRDLGRVMATVKLAEPTVTVRKKTFGTPWTALDAAVDLNERNLDNIYLFFTLNIDVEEERSGMFSSGRIYLRSADTNGKENSAYCTVDTLKLHKGENILYIPLSALNKQNNVMDWSDVRSFRMYIDSVNQYDQNMTFTFSDIQILDSENRIPDSPEKVELKQLLRLQRMDLTSYTLGSIAAYNALFEQGWSVYRNVDATDEEVRSILAAVKTADELLVLDENAKDVLGVLKTEEVVSNEGHYMKVDIKAGEAIDISKYKEGEVYLQFDVRLDTTHTDPAPSNDNWIQWVKNGKVELGETALAARTVVRNVQAVQIFSKSGSYVTVRETLPAELVEKGSVQAFFMFLYNDTGALGTDADGITWDSGNGVVFRVRNVKILADKEKTTDPVERDSLQEALTARKTGEQLADYTDDSVAAYNKLFDDAKAVYDNLEATQQQIDEAVASLQNADQILVEKEPVIIKGDMNKDGHVTAEDALMVLQAATGKITLTAEREQAADVDGKDGVTANDALLILQYATKKINQF